MLKHHDQGNLWNKEFVLASGSRVRDRTGMDKHGSRHGDKSRRAKSSHLQPQTQNGERKTGSEAGL